MTSLGTLPDPPSEDAGYAAEWPVRIADADRHGGLRLDGIARYLQDIAWEDLHAGGFAGTDPTWIVRRTVIDVIRPIRWPARVSLRRWCSGLSTRWANMRVRIVSDAGGLVETEAFWIKVDETTGATARISDSGFAHLATTTEQHRLRWTPLLDETPPPRSQRDLPFALREADIDLNGHVNNTVYWQAVEQFLPDHTELLVGPYRAVLEYRGPVTAEQALRIRTEDRRTGLHLWFLTGENVSATGLVTPLYHPPTPIE